MKFLKFLASIFIITTFVGASYLVVDKFVLDINFSAYGDDPTNIKEVDEISTIEHFKENANLNKKNPFAILLLGLDSKDDFKDTRSDSIILSIVNPKENKVTLLSVYRDLLVDIPGRDGQDKLNAAYAYGGVDLTAATLQNLFEVPIEQYAIINFQGFEDLVDAINGVEIDVEFNMNTKGRSMQPPYDILEGTQTLNGHDTLNYVRFRSAPDGDFGRTRRQKQAITAIADQTMELRNITNLYGIYDSINKNLKSNIGKFDIAQLAISMRDLSGSDVESLVMEANPTSRRGISYVEATEEEINRISEILQNHLKGNYDHAQANAIN